MAHPKHQQVRTRFNFRCGYCVALSDAGLFHITLLHLNRPQLVENRLEKRARGLEKAHTQQLEAMIEQLSSAVAELTEMVERLKNEEPSP